MIDMLSILFMLGAGLICYHYQSVLAFGIFLVVFSSFMGISQVHMEEKRKDQ